MSKIGYIRVSTTEQETGRQEELMKQIGVDKTFIDKATGKNIDRPEFKSMMSYLPSLTNPYKILRGNLWDCDL